MREIGPPRTLSFHSFGGPYGPARSSDRTPPVAEPADERFSLDLLHALEHLRATIVRYVGERREQGAAVERVLPEVKSLLRRAEASEQWLDPSDTLLAQVVRWTVEAYYDDPKLQLVPRFY
jgi:hypothetical protein